MRWRVWTEAGTLDFGPFVATSLDAAEYLPFFDQYARSQSPWSPGSDAFAYAGTSEGGESGIWVQPVEEGVSPVLVAEGGRHVSWSDG